MILNLEHNKIVLTLYIKETKKKARRRREGGKKNYKRRKG